MKHDFQNLVPHVPVGESRKAEIEDILRTGNRLLKRHHEAMKRASGLKKHSRVAFLKMVSESFRPGEDVAVGGIVVPAADAESILSVGKVEWELLGSFSSMITQIVRRWSRGRDVCLSYDDLTGEAYVAAKLATIHFIDENVRFCTFLHGCVSRHLSKICGQTNSLSALSPSVVRLRLKCRKLMSREGANFDSVVKEMRLSKFELSRLRAAMCEVRGSSFDDSASNLDDPFVESGLLEKVGKIEFSDLERAVLEGFLGDGLGSVAKKLVNPATQKPYSRMAFTFAFRRVKEKIAEVCEVS